jgi:hypothetical protein
MFQKTYDDSLNLTVLSLEENNLSGNLPPEMEGMSNLIFANLSHNSLTGSIPPEFGNMPSIRWLDLSKNNLSGGIPSEIGNLSSLEWLILNVNRLSGSIPQEMVNLTKLRDPFPDEDHPEVIISPLHLESNLLEVPPGYPVPGDPLQTWLAAKDTDWHLYQGSQAVIDSEGGMLVTSNGHVQVEFPSGMLTIPITATLIPRPDLLHEAGVYIFAHNTFDLSAEDQSGNPMISFSQPITITLAYTDTAVIPGIESTLRLLYWDLAAQQYSDAAAICPAKYHRDLTSNHLTLPVCLLSEFGLFVDPLYNYLPAIIR